MPEREVTVHRFEQLWREGDRAAFAIECSAGTYVRSLIAELGDAYCEELRRTRDRAVRRRGRRPGARASPLEQALRSCRAVARWRATPRGAPATVRRSRASADGAEVVLLLDADGPIAIAEPREGGVLKPIVGFRA